MKNNSKLIKKCLFPAAGYGTRFLPATKAIPKEMLPVLTKPLLQYGVEEAIEAGMNTMAIVTGRGKRSIEDHFDISYELEHQIKGTPKEHYLTEIRSVINKCTFSYTRQVEMKGLGHAILTGQTLIGNEAFAVILADDLCDNSGCAALAAPSNVNEITSEAQSGERHGLAFLKATHPKKSVLTQMTEVYEQYPDCCIVAIEEVPKEETNKYGVIAGEAIGEAQSGERHGLAFLEATHPRAAPGCDPLGSPSLGSAASAAPSDTDKSNLFKVTNMVEKPDNDKAPTNQAVIGRYILTPDIFDMIKNTKPGKNGELQITDALCDQAKKGMVIAYRFKGKRFDCGSVDGFVEATNYFYKLEKENLKGN